jgi:hypothetical protein
VTKLGVSAKAIRTEEERDGLKQQFAQAAAAQAEAQQSIQ